MLALRLTTAEGRPSDLLVAHSGATFAAALTMLLLAPLVALYQFSSAWAGPIVAMVTVVLGFVCGVAVFIRMLRKLGGVGPAIVVPVLLLAVVQIASLAQLSRSLRRSCRRARCWVTGSTASRRRPRPCSDHGRPDEARRRRAPRPGHRRRSSVRPARRLRRRDVLRRTPFEEACAARPSDRELRDEIDEVSRKEPR